MVEVRVRQQHTRDAGGVCAELFEGNEEVGSERGETSIHQQYAALVFDQVNVGVGDGQLVNALRNVTEQHGHQATTARATGGPQRERGRAFLIVNAVSPRRQALDGPFGREKAGDGNGRGREAT
jgi:hypothetical protein